MSVVAVLAAARAAAESRMTDTATVARVTGRSTNGTTGVVTATTSTVYSGACRFKPGTQALTADAGGHAFTLTPAEVHFPVGAFAPAVGDRVTFTASQTDTSAVGRVVVVTSRPMGSQTSALRVPVEEVSA